MSSDIFLKIIEENLRKVTKFSKINKIRTKKRIDNFV